MTLRTIGYSAALLFFTLWGTGVTHAQSIVEYGVMTGNSAALGASGRPLIPFPNMGNLGGAPSAGTVSGVVSGPAGVAAGNAEAAAKTNVQYFQVNAGPNAAQVAVHTVPDKASAWIDGKFVGSAPLNLKLAPGHHQLLIRSPNMQEAMQGIDLAAKQSQSINVALKSASQSQVMIQWPSGK